MTHDDIARTFHTHTTTNPTQHRNAINQTAHKHQTSERHVHAALYHYACMLHRLDDALGQGRN